MNVCTVLYLLCWENKWSCFPSFHDFLCIKESFFFFFWNIGFLFTKKKKKNWIAFRSTDARNKCIVHTGCWPPALPLSAARSGRNHHPPPLLPTWIGEPYQVYIKHRSCANMNSPYNRKFWTNSVGPLVYSLLWECARTNRNNSIRIWMDWEKFLLLY